MYNILTFIPFTFFKRFLLEIVQENRTEAVRPQGGPWRKEKRKEALASVLFGVHYSQSCVGTGWCKNGHVFTW